MLLRRIAFGLLMSAALLAQGERGTFNGTVLDASGAAVAGALVKVLNPATGVEVSSATTEAGVYRMPALSAGTYRISVAAPGFKGAIRDNVVLSVAQTLTVDFNMEVGQYTGPQQGPRNIEIALRFNF